MIQRLQWLYPPTANRFFFNLMSILCDRLESVTDTFACESIVDDLTGWYNRKGFINILETETIGQKDTRIRAVSLRHEAELIRR